MIWLMLLLVWAALVALLWAGSLWFQAYIYNEPDPDLYWRAPAAASALTLFLGLWFFIDYRHPGDYAGLFAFSPREDVQFKEFRAVKGKTETLFQLRHNAQGIAEYRQTTPPYNAVPVHPDAVIVRDANGQESRFEPERDEHKDYLIHQGKSLLYIGPGGLFMTEDNLGVVSNFRWGRFLGNVLLNLFHFIVWFVCLWLLLRFQWAHALGIAAVFWLLLTIVILPMLLGKVEALAPKPTPKVALVGKVQDLVRKTVIYQPNSAAG